MRRRSRFPGLVTLALLGASVAGCATGSGAKGGRVPPVAGRWEGLSNTRLTQGQSAGDTRIERQAWELTQRGRLVSGFYVIELTMISGDGRPYVCSRTPRFSTLVRFELRGRVGSDRIELEEVGERKVKGPCRPTFRTPERYVAQVQGNVLTVLGAGRKQTLYRRIGATGREDDLATISFDTDGHDEVVFPQPARPPRLVPSATPPQDIAGYWVWEARGVLPSGDEKHEREEWHLVQEGNTISGYYDRAIRQVSTDGQAYRCSGGLDFRILTRYQVVGEIQADRLVLQERSFEVLEPSPCDDGHRRLDAYEGRASGGEIHLIWGVGRQVLKKSRPEVPTQRL